MRDAAVTRLSEEGANWRARTALDGHESGSAREFPLSEPGSFAPDFPKRLKQLWPLLSEGDLEPLSYDAAMLVQSGEIEKPVAVDDVREIALRSGHFDHYGDNAEHFIQARMTLGFARAEIEARNSNAATDAFNSELLDIRAIEQTHTAPVSHVRAIELCDFLKLDIAPRSMVLTPWLPEQGLAMLYAPRGTGKTRIAHGVGHAIATGSGFLRWTASQPRRVLLLDGENAYGSFAANAEGNCRSQPMQLGRPKLFQDRGG
jgi:hypothetical protein